MFNKSLTILLLTAGIGAILLAQAFADDTAENNEANAQNGQQTGAEEQPGFARQRRSVAKAHGPHNHQQAQKLRGRLSRGHNYLQLPDFMQGRARDSSASILDFRMPVRLRGKHGSRSRSRSISRSSESRNRRRGHGRRHRNRSRVSRSDDSKRRRRHGRRGRGHRRRSLSRSSDSGRRRRRHGIRKGRGHGRSFSRSDEHRRLRNRRHNRGLGHRNRFQHGRFENRRPLRVFRGKHQRRSSSERSHRSGTDEQNVRVKSRNLNKNVNFVRNSQQPAAIAAAAAAASSSPCCCGVSVADGTCTSCSCGSGSTVSVSDCGVSGPSCNSGSQNCTCTPSSSSGTCQPICLDLFFNQLPGYY